MEKRKVKILVVDRPLKQEEKPVSDIFDVYRDRGFDIIIFPWKKNKPCTEVVIFDYSVFDEAKELFCLSEGEYDEDVFYDFDLEGIEEQTFYDVLDQRFEIETSNLTDEEAVKA